jgi:hypothetical protein
VVEWENAQYWDILMVEISIVLYFYKQWTTQNERDCTPHHDIAHFLQGSSTYAREKTRQYSYAHAWASRVAVVFFPRAYRSFFSRLHLIVHFGLIGAF